MNTTADTTTGETVSLLERIVVAPCAGRFKPAPVEHFTTEGEYVVEDQVIGEVISPDGRRVEIRSRFAGWVMGFLVADGAPVRAAEAVAWLRKL